MSIIQNIEQLKKLVKINSSIPFSSVSPFLNTAQEIYLVRYLGRELLTKINDENMPEKYIELCNKAASAEGLLAMWLGNAELSVRISDSGFTVERTDTLAPASDSKIAEVKQSLCMRAFQHLDSLLEYLEDHVVEFPEWALSRYYSGTVDNYIRSARQFQDTGSVNIQSSLLRFEEMRPLMRQVQDRYVREMLGEELDTQLRSKENITDEHERKLFDYACKFIANKTAELYTSENSIRNKSSIDRATYDRFTLPVYFDLQNTGNFYADQAQFYYGKLERAFNDYLVANNKSPATAVMDWNTDEKKLFIDIG